MPAISSIPSNPRFNQNPILDRTRRMPPFARWCGFQPPTSHPTRQQGCNALHQPEFSTMALYA
jgi:hypothetical protein